MIWVMNNWSLNLTSLNEYQVAARKYAVYKDPMYPVLALGEEAGEVLGKFAKANRKGVTPCPIEVAKELGDTLWQLSAIAADLGFTLEQIANMNLEKLQDRMNRSVLVGEGDNR